MGRGKVALVAALGVAVVLIWAAVWRTVAPALADASPSPTADAGATPPPSAATSLSPMQTSTPTPTPAPAATETPPPTPVSVPPDEVDPGVAWVAFLAHLDGLRPEAAALTDALISAADDGDRPGVRASAIDILQLADRERDWLGANPPAACYAEAHAAAGAMVEAYADIGERAIAWAESDDGLDALGALAELIAGAGVARDALADLATALEAATCLP